MIIIGSTRLKQLYPNFPREPKDVDLLVEKKGSPTVHKVNKYKIEECENPVLYNYIQTLDILEVDINILFTLKLSHMFWDIKWEKHMFDIQWIQSHSCVTVLPTLFDDLFNYWQTLHGPRQSSNLALSHEEFFDNAITCPIPHDELHTTLNPTPIYLSCLKNDGTVDLSEEKWKNLNFLDKIKLITEEVSVMAWERYPQEGHLHAYHKMLKKFILHHAPIYIAKFALIFYSYVKLPLQNYKQIFELKYGTRSIRNN